MSGDAGGGLRPRIQKRALAPPDSLAARLMAGAGPVRMPLAARLREAPEPRGGKLPAAAFGSGSAAAARKLERILAGEGHLVSTGHQPIFLLGPLYVLYKALTAIEVARALEDRWERPVLAVFWVASDDHDWEEVACTKLLDRESRLVTLRIEPSEEHAGRPVGPAPLGPHVSDRLARLSEMLPPSEFTPHYLDSIHDAYREERSFAAGFTGLLETLLDGRDYAWIDAHHPAVKEGAASWFREILDDPNPYLAAGSGGAARLSEAGHEPPVPNLEGGLPLFFDTGERRERLYATGEGIRAGREGEPRSAVAWQEALAGEPEAFSPNVSSRPVLESRLMPVSATVLGPGEIAYWSQLPPLFDAAGVPFPAVQPRASWTLVEARIQKLLDRFDLEPEALEDGGEGAAERLTETSRPEAVDESLRELRAAVGRALGPVQEAVGDALPGLKATVGKTRKSLFDAVEELEEQVDRETRDRLEVEIGQVRRCAANLYPERRPQERVLSPFYYLARYGSDLVDDLEAATREWLEDGLAKADSDG